MTKFEEYSKKIPSDVIYQYYKDLETEKRTRGYKLNYTALREASRYNSNLDIPTMANILHLDYKRLHSLLSQSSSLDQYDNIEPSGQHVGNRLLHMFGPVTIKEFRNYMRMQMDISEFDLTKTYKRVIYTVIHDKKTYLRECV